MPRFRFGQCSGTSSPVWSPGGVARRAGSGLSWSSRVQSGFSQASPRRTSRSRSRSGSRSTCCLRCSSFMCSSRSRADVWRDKIRHWSAKNKREIDTESIYAIHTWNVFVDTTDLSVSVLFYRKISSNPK